MGFRNHPTPGLSKSLWLAWRTFWVLCNGHSLTGGLDAARSLAGDFLILLCA